MAAAVLLAVTGNPQGAGCMGTVRCAADAEDSLCRMAPRWRWSSGVAVIASHLMKQEGEAKMQRLKICFFVMRGSQIKTPGGLMQADKWHLLQGELRNRSGIPASGRLKNGGKTEGSNLSRMEHPSIDALNPRCSGRRTHGFGAAPPCLGLFSSQWADSHKTGISVKSN